MKAHKCAIQQNTAPGDRKKKTCPFEEFEMVSLFYLFAYILVRGLKGFIINRMLL